MRGLPSSTMLGLGMVFNAMTFVVFMIYGLSASFARDYVIAGPRAMVWLRRSFAGAFGVLGLKLALSER